MCNAHTRKQEQQLLMLIEMGCSRIEQEQPTLKLYMKLLYILSSNFLYSCQLLEFLRPPHAYKHITKMCNAESAPAIIVHDISILRNTSFPIAVFLGKA